ncbi:MAG: DUF2203 family protein [Dehalococcoidia bacterium]|nr:DUF2203 family protein [Dehalococcoidia bacterium]
MQHRLFTLDEANHMLPWLREKLAEIDKHREAFARTQGSRSERHPKSHTNGHAANEQNIGFAPQGAQSPERLASAVIQEILQQGIVIRDPVRGLVDFPSIRDGREIHLCWTRDEPDIRFWHTLDTGFADRQPLP